MKNICPVCGYDKLDFSPYDKEGYASFDICPCCGFQFGNDDFPDKELSFATWRKNWIENGCIWFSRGIKPENWNADEQLKKFNNEHI